MKLIKILGAVVIVLIVVAIIGRNKGWFGSSSGIAVETDTAAIREILETVTASGKIYPYYEVKISAEISGEIVELPVHEGDYVRTGQLLVRINPDLYQSQVAQAQAGLNNAKANLASTRSQLVQANSSLENATLSYNRSKQLYEEKVISKAEYEQADLAFKNAQAQYEMAQQSVYAAEFTVKSAEAALKEMQDNLKRTAIYAPIDGTVFGLSKKIGEKVLGTIQMSGDVLMSIADLSNMEVQVDVSENDVLRLSINDTAEIDVDAYLNRKFKGVVTQIANSAGETGLAAMSTEQATNFKVKIKILQDSYADIMPANKQDKYPFYPGMSATVDVRTKIEKNTLSIPIGAVTTKEDSLRPGELQEITFRIVNDTARQVVIKTGIQDDNFIQVIDGLQAGEEIVSGPYNTVSAILKDGDLVKREKNSDSSKK